MRFFCHNKQFHFSFIISSKNVFDFSGSDAAASLVDSNGQDMIVVIQSDDYDQSQGLIVVDPSQLQHMVTSAGGGHITGMYLYNLYNYSMNIELIEKCFVFNQQNRIIRTWIPFIIRHL